MTFLKDLEDTYILRQRLLKTSLVDMAMFDKDIFNECTAWLNYINIEAQYNKKYTWTKGNHLNFILHYNKRYHSHF